MHEYHEVEKRRRKTTHKSREMITLMKCSEFDIIGFTMKTVAGIRRGGDIGQSVTTTRKEEEERG